MDIVVARPVCPISGGTQAEVDVGVSGVMILWSLVGVDNLNNEIAAHGELAQSYSRTNVSGKAFNYYFAPNSMPPVDYKDRLKASIYG